MSPDPAPAEQRERLPQVLKLLTEAASLVALATALLYYFGWVRSETQAHAFGADASVFMLSSNELVLRSIDVVFVPALLMLLVAWAAVLGHRRLVGGRGARETASAQGMPPSQRRRLQRIAGVLRFAWLVPVVVGIPLLALRPSAGVLSLPFWFALAVLGTSYGAHLRRTAAADRSAQPLYVLLLAGALFAVTMFWMTERVARIGGEARTDAIKADVAGNLEGVTVYSAARLQLDGGGIVETDLQDPDAAFGYRYDGLFLLQQSGGKYFLISPRWDDGSGRLVVLADDASVRLEFGPGR